LVGFARFSKSIEPPKAPLPKLVKTSERASSVVEISTTVPAFVTRSASPQVSAPKVKPRSTFVRPKKSKVPSPGSSNVRKPVPTIGGSTLPLSVSSNSKSKVTSAAAAGSAARVSAPARASADKRMGFSRDMVRVLLGVGIFAWTIGNAEPSGVSASDIF
jgi:hypothetical protein